MQTKDVKETIEDINAYFEKAKSIIVSLRKIAMERIRLKPINEFRLTGSELKEVIILLDIVIKKANELIDELKRDEELSEPIKKRAFDIAATAREFSLIILGKIEPLTARSIKGQEAFDLLEEAYKIRTKIK